MYQQHNLRRTERSLYVLLYCCCYYGVLYCSALLLLYFCDGASITITGCRRVEYYKGGNEERDRRLEVVKLLTALSCTTALLAVLSFVLCSSINYSSSGPLVRNSNLGLLIVLIPYRASQFQYNFLWSVSYWSGWKKSQFLVVSNFLPRWCLICPLACQVTPC